MEGCSRRERVRALVLPKGKVVLAHSPNTGGVGGRGGRYVCGASCPQWPSKGGGTGSRHVASTQGTLIPPLLLSLPPLPGRHLLCSVELAGSSGRSMEHSCISVAAGEVLTSALLQGGLGKGQPAQTAPTRTGRVMVSSDQPCSNRSISVPGLVATSVPLPSHHPWPCDSALCWSHFPHSLA